MKNVSFCFYGVVMILITMLLSGCYVPSSTNTGITRDGKPGYDYAQTGSHFPFEIPAYYGIEEERQVKECAAVFNFFTTQIPGAATVSTAKSQYGAGLKTLVNAFDKNYDVRIADAQDAIDTLYNLGLEVPDDYRGYGRREEQRYVAKWMRECKAQKMIASNMAKEQRRQEIINSGRIQRKNTFSGFKQSLN